VPCTQYKQLMHRLCVLMGIVLTQSAPAQHCPFFWTNSLACWMVFPAVTMEGILLWSWLLSGADRMMMMGLQRDCRSMIPIYGRRLFRSSCSYVCAGTDSTCARWVSECLCVWSLLLGLSLSSLYTVVCLYLGCNGRVCVDVGA
jgi:hypothetical protein